ncbi:MAG: AI-2E family transporter [Clostridiaceae bacterium]|nr:AI-2E family transporter [Clostridiaceae bacterium]
MKKQTLWYNFIFLLCISIGVYLFFRYLLTLIFPFLAAYVLMRILFPVMDFLHKKCRWPHFLSHYGTLFLFFAAIISGTLFLLSKIIGQLRLFFSNFPVYRQILKNTFSQRANTVCSCIDYYFHLESGTSDSLLKHQIAQFNQNISESFSENLGTTLISCASSWFRVIAILFMICISMFLLVKELEPINKKYRNSRYYQQTHSILLHVKKSGLSYLRTEGIILTINWFICSLGLFLIHNSYFFLLGMGIAVIDALPILGSGLVLIPMSLYFFINSSYLSAAILLTAYILTLLSREFLEAKLLGEGMGLNPFFMLAAIFIGLQLFGIAGILLGPLSVVLIRGIYALVPKPD